MYNMTANQLYVKLRIVKTLTQEKYKWRAYAFQQYSAYLALKASKLLGAWSELGYSTCTVWKHIHYRGKWT